MVLFRLNRTETIYIYICIVWNITVLFYEKYIQRQHICMYIIVLFCSINFFDETVLIWSAEEIKRESDIEILLSNLNRRIAIGFDYQATINQYPATCSSRYHEIRTADWTDCRSHLFTYSKINNEKSALTNRLFISFKWKNPIIGSFKLRRTQKRNIRQRRAILLAITVEENEIVEMADKHHFRRLNRIIISIIRRYIFIPDTISQFCRFTDNRDKRIIEKPTFWWNS